MNLLGAEKGSQPFAGNLIDGWEAPPLNALASAFSGGASQPSMRLPAKGWLPFSAPSRFIGVWQAAQCAAPSTR